MVTSGSCFLNSARALRSQRIALVLYLFPLLSSACGPINSAIQKASGGGLALVPQGAGPVPSRLLPVAGLARELPPHPQALHSASSPCCPAAAAVWRSGGSTRVKATPSSVSCPLGRCRTGWATWEASVVHILPLFGPLCLESYPGQPCALCHLLAGGMAGTTVSPLSMGFSRQEY